MRPPDPRYEFARQGKIGSMGMMGTLKLNVMARMATCPDTLKRLIERFDQQADQVRSPNYNEAQLRIDFVIPLFAQLGWDIDNAQGFAEQYREVVYDDRVKVAGATKAPVDSFRIGGSASVIQRL